MARGVELRKLPPQIVVEAYLSGSTGGPNSYGGLDAKGPMVVFDLEKGELVTLPGFEERVKGWREVGGKSPCLLAKMPTLPLFNAYLNGHAHFNLWTRQIEPKTISSAISSV